MSLMSGQKLLFFFIVFVSIGCLPQTLEVGQSIKIDVSTFVYVDHQSKFSATFKPSSTGSKMLIQGKLDYEGLFFETAQFLTHTGPTQIQIIGSGQLSIQKRNLICMQGYMDFEEKACECVKGYGGRRCQLKLTTFKQSQTFELQDQVTYLQMNKEVLLQLGTGNLLIRTLNEDNPFQSEIIQGVEGLQYKVGNKNDPVIISLQRSQTGGKTSVSINPCPPDYSFTTLLNQTVKNHTQQVCVLLMAVVAFMVYITIAKIKSYMWKVLYTETGSPQECPICLAKPDQDGKVYKIRLGCKHEFHVSCLDAWIKRSSTCPVCRTDFTNFLTLI